MIFKMIICITGALFITTLLFEGRVIKAEGLSEREVELFASNLAIKLSEKEKKFIKGQVEAFLEHSQFVDPNKSLAPMSRMPPTNRQESVKSVSFDQPLPIFHIQLNDIRGYNPETSLNLNTILTPTKGGLLPVGPKKKLATEKLNVQSFVPLIRNSRESIDGGMRYSYREPRQKLYYYLLFDARSEVEERERVFDEPVQSFGIFYPVLARYFLGYLTADKKVIIKVLEDGPGDLKRGQERSAQDVFAVLSKDANENRNKEFESAGNPLKQFSQLQGRQ